jgi:hypothetical protein
VGNEAGRGSSQPTVTRVPLQSDDPCFDPLHAYFVERLLPVCAQLLLASIDAGEILETIEPRELMRGVGNLCIGG